MYIAVEMYAPVVYFNDFNLEVNVAIISLFFCLYIQ